MFDKLSLRAKLLIALGLITVTLFSMAMVASFSVHRLKADTIVLAEGLLPAVDFIVEADRDMQQALVAERSLLYVKPGTADFDRLAKEHEENIGQANSRIQKYSAVAVAAQGKEMAERYFKLHREWAEVSKRVVELAAGAELSDKQTALTLSFGDGAVRFGSARDLLDRLTDFELEHAKTVSSDVESVAAKAYSVMIGAAGVGVLLILLVMFTFPGMVVNPLQRITARLTEFSSGQGDLTARLDVDRDDEIGELAKAFNGFLSTLNALILDVGQVSPKLAGAASQLCVVAERSSAKTAQQQRETEQVVTAINEMAISIQDIARNASEAANVASEADAQVGRGDEVVSQTINHIGRLANSVEDLGGVMQRLNADSQNIGSVLDVIRGIAEQTNLLALNAAIEAARAGEQGRGFAVVADEVRTLASRTQESTLEIQEMVERLQAAADEAVSTVQVGRDVAQGTVEHAHSTRDVLDAIRTSVSSITGMSMQIASAVEQQGAVAAEVDRNISRIGQISDGNSADAAHIAASGEELKGLATELQRHVGRFRV